MGRIAVAFLLGVCAVHTLGALPESEWSILLAIGLFAAIGLRSAWAVAWLAGFGWAWLSASVRLGEDLAASLEGKDIELSGYVASLPDAILDDRQFEFDVIHGPKGSPRRVRLSWRGAESTPRVGELWRFTVRLKRRNGFANPGGFDYEAYLLRAGIGATGYVREDGAAERLQPAGMRYPATQVRAWLARRIEFALEGSSMLGVIQGLAIGDTRAMSAEQWRVFAATGTTHLMAISGLHIGMVAALAAWAGGALVRRARRAQRRGWNALHAQALVGLAAAAAYSVLAGLSIPTQRTLIMLTVYFAARWMRREISVGRVLGASLVAVLLVDPFAPLQIGAWLSFGAVAVIVLAMSGRVEREGVLNGFTRLQVALTIGLAPFLLAAFGALSIASPFVNAFAAPLFTFVIVPLVLLGALAAALNGVLGGAVLAAPEAILNVLWPLLEFMADRPFAVWRFAHAPPVVFAAFVLGVACLLLPGLWVMRLAGVLLCTPFIVYRPPTPRPGDFQLTVLDVGQGLASVVRTHSHVLVYDAGPAFQSGRDAGELVLLPYLYARGVRGIDRLVVSHGHADHQGGARSVLAALQVEGVLHGPSVAKLEGALCELGQTWVWDDVRFSVLHPTRTTPSGHNDSSCVIEIRGTKGSALLTGDIEQDAEQELVAALAPVTVVVAPHHGSATSSTPSFVDVLRPRAVVFAAGYRNRWAFPRAEVTARWGASGARTLTTIESGAIEILPRDAGELPIREHRRASRRYWRR